MPTETADQATDLALPSLGDLTAPPRRVIWHWTAGGLFATKRERSCYHVLIERLEGHPHDPTDDRIVYRAGVPIARNMRSVAGLPSYAHDRERGYAAHVARLNAYSIGVAMCGMRGAVDYRNVGRGVRPGPSPITALQVRALLSISVVLASVYDLEVSERTFLGHYEVERVYGIALTRGRWDPSWIPTRHDLDPGEVGDYLREQLVRWLAGSPIDDAIYDPPEGASSLDESAGEEG